MSSAAANAAAQGNLPELSGRLLWSYRLLACAFAIGAILASALTAVHHGSVTALVVIRVLKSAILIGVAIILFCRRQRDPVAALLALAFLAWTITSSFDLGTSVVYAQLLDRLRFLLFALALLLFPDGRWQPGWTRAVAAISAAVFLIGVGEELHLLPTRAFLPLAIPCVLAAIGALVARFRTSADYVLKQQLKWVALGLVAGVGLILCARAGSAAPSLNTAAMPILWEALFQLGIILVALGFLVSLLRFRLFDAETVISRSAAYAALTVALVATFGGTEAAIENLGQLYLGMNVGSISGAMAAAVAAVLLNPLHGRLSEWAEERFQPDLAQLKREIPNLIARLEGTSSTRDLWNAVLPQISNAIHAVRSAFVTEGRVVAASGITVAQARQWTCRWLRKEVQPGTASDGYFPVQLPVAAAGSNGQAWILLGPRPDGTLYGREDLDAVRSILPAMQQASVITMHREALNKAIEDREKHLRTEIRHISARLEALENAST